MNKPTENDMEDSEYTDIQRHAAHKAGIVVSVRLKPDEAELLRALAARDRRTLSETFRAALHAYAQRPATPRTGAVSDQPMTRGNVFREQPDPARLILT